MRKHSLFLWVLLLVDGVASKENDEVEVSVTLGKPVTLSTDVDEIPSDTVQWRFGDKVIAKMNKASNIYNISDGPDGIFKDKLELDNKTGSLTIKDISHEHAGRYELQIKSTTETRKKFSVIVHVVKSVSRIKGDSFSLAIDVKVQQDDQIQWKFEGQVIPADHLNGSWSNIHVNKETGELRFTKIKIEQSGSYEVEINTSSLILHRKFIIKVEPPPSGAGSGLCGAGVSLVVWMVAVFLLQEV